jgi:hypothetical protein
MRKFVYPLAAVLCFYASANCYALTDGEVQVAKNKYTTFELSYEQFKPRAEQQLKDAKAAKKKGTKYDYTDFKGYTGPEIDKLNTQFVAPIGDLHKKDPSDKTVKKLNEKAKSKIKELYKLKRDIEETM